jgi:hypothetical protein
MAADAHAVSALLDDARREFAGAALDRLACALTGGRVTPTDPSQRPGFLFLPFLESRPWFEPHASPWVESFEREYEAIRRECLALYAGKRGFTGYAEPDGSPSFWDGEWRACYLFHSGFWFGETAAACPRTTRLLHSVPRLDEYALFSALEPGGHIRPHCGPWNARLTYHFGIAIPEASAIQVGGTVRRWEEGKFLVFDDSFEHGSWNAGPSVRIVLMFTAWHPDLTEAEVEVLRRYDRLFPMPGHGEYVQTLLARSRASHGASDEAACLETGP